MVVEYYMSCTHSWLLPPAAAVRVLTMLKMFVDRSSENPFQINGFPAFLDLVLQPGERQDFIFGAHLLMTTAVYGMLEQVVGADPSSLDQAAGSRGQPASVEVLTTQIDALFCAYTWLTQTREDRPGDLAKICQYVDYTFSDVGANGDGFNHRTLLWCICCLYIQR
eukprot:7514635-Ditylum_brightwellii.AAC.1